MGQPSPSQSPADDLIKIQGNPRVLAIGIVIIVLVGLWLIAKARRDTQPPPNGGWR